MKHAGVVVLFSAVFALAAPAAAMSVSGDFARTLVDSDGKVGSILLEMEARASAHARELEALLASHSFGESPPVALADEKARKKLAKQKCREAVWGSKEAALERNPADGAPSSCYQGDPAAAAAADRNCQNQVADAREIACLVQERDPDGLVSGRDPLNWWDIDAVRPNADSSEPLIWRSSLEACQPKLAASLNCGLKDGTMAETICPKTRVDECLDVENGEGNQLCVVEPVTGGFGCCLDTATKLKCREPAAYGIMCEDLGFSRSSGSTCNNMQHDGIAAGTAGICAAEKVLQEGLPLLKDVDRPRTEPVPDAELMRLHAVEQGGAKCRIGALPGRCKYWTESQLGQLEGYTKDEAICLRNKNWAETEGEGHRYKFPSPLNKQIPSMTIERQAKGTPSIYGKGGNWQKYRGRCEADVLVAESAHEGEDPCRDGAICCVDPAPLKKLHESASTVSKFEGDGCLLREIGSEYEAGVGSAGTCKPFKVCKAEKRGKGREQIKDLQLSQQAKSSHKDKHKHKELKVWEYTRKRIAVWDSADRDPCPKDSSDPLVCCLNDGPKVEVPVAATGGPGKLDLSQNPWAKQGPVAQARTLPTKRASEGEDRSWKWRGAERKNRNSAA